MRLFFDRGFRMWMLPGLGLAAVLTTGCGDNTPSSTQVQQQAEHATEVAKQSAEDAAAAARKAAALAEQDVHNATKGITVQRTAQNAAEVARNAAQAAENGVDAVANGVKQGLNAPGGADGSAATDAASGSNGDRVHLNTASRSRLATLPGISGAKAGAIVDGRPYAHAHDLVTRGILTEDQYRRIAGDVTAK
jgi:DNA uptake protein ComE-like DNA-binding protein